jgi:hypothetical protein
MKGILVGVAAAALVALAGAPAASPAGGTQAAFSDVVSNSCTGEAVLVTGVMHVTENVADNHDYVYVNWQNTRGVALVTGTPYQANDVTHLVTSATSSGSTTYFQDEFELVSLGPSPNLLVHMRVGLSVDKNGNPQPIMQGDAKCSGSG